MWLEASDPSEQEEEEAGTTHGRGMRLTLTGACWLSAVVFDMAEVVVKACCVPWPEKVCESGDCFGSWHQFVWQKRVIPTENRRLARRARRSVRQRKQKNRRTYTLTYMYMVLLASSIIGYHLVRDFNINKEIWQNDSIRFFLSA